MTTISEDALFQNFDFNLQIKNAVHDTKYDTYAKNYVALITESDTKSKM